MKLSHVLRRVLSGLSWLLLAAVCACTFYLVAVMGEQPQTADGASPSPAATPLPTPAPLAAQADLRTPEQAQAYFPAPLLTLAGEAPMGVAAQDLRAGTTSCRVVTLTYARADGSQVRCVSATPAAYLTTLTGAGLAPAAMDGARLRGLDALRLTGGGAGALLAQDGDVIYLLLGPDDPQSLQALGEATL